jgi:nicotinate-nucleotide pyrophosphorylase (carboxylating)
MALDTKTKELVARAIKEDIGSGDITAKYAVPEDRVIQASVVAKEDLVVCGLYLAKEVLFQVDKSIKCKLLKKEGDSLIRGQPMMSLKGKAVSILTAERTMLNFLMHLSAIASKTREFVNIAKEYNVQVLDTRKTVPGLRSLHKYAVRTGGGKNHRKGLWDQVIIKENHLISAGLKARGKVYQEYVEALIANLRKSKRKNIEIEVESLKEFYIACKCRPDIILLDNFTPARVQKAVKFRNRYFSKIKLEASGRINAGNIRRFVQAGSDYVSIGSLTHSFQAKDISLEVK